MAMQPIDNGKVPPLSAQRPGGAYSASRRGEPSTPAQSVPSGAAPPVPVSDIIDFSKGALDLGKSKPATPDGAGQSGAAAQNDLSSEEQKQIQQLKQRDAEVRRHEQAHLSAAGSYARGGASYSYTTGPDGKRYATGGEVSMDVSAESTPEATIAKMQTVKRAAMAPAEPSAQDRAVYAQAARAELKARQDAAQEKVEEARAQNEDKEPAVPAPHAGRSAYETREGPLPSASTPFDRRA